MALKVTAGNETGDTIYWNYPFFRIGDRSSRYALSTSVGRGTGNVQYSPFGYEGSSRHYFETYDFYTDTNCGFTRQSGWWYYRDNCNFANLNSRHKPSRLYGMDAAGNKLVWRTASNTYSVYAHTEMMIRPQSCAAQ